MRRISAGGQRLPRRVPVSLSWENGYVGSFNGKLRNELLAAEASKTLAEAEVLIERWRRYYNTGRSHSCLGYRPPSPEVAMPDAPTPSGRPRPDRISTADRSRAPLICSGPPRGGWSPGLLL